MVKYSRRICILNVLEEEGMFMTATRIHNKLPLELCMSALDTTLNMLRKLVREGKVERRGGPEHGVMWVFGLEGFPEPNLDNIPDSRGTARAKLRRVSYENQQRRRKFKRAAEKRKTKQDSLS